MGLEGPARRCASGPKGWIYYAPRTGLIRARSANSLPLTAIRHLARSRADHEASC
jgi:hypothetical protein